MNNKELQALRKLLMLDVSEAAEHVGKVSNRTWQYWESGRSPVPDDVEQEMLDLSSTRDYQIEETMKSAKRLGSNKLNLAYYTSFEEYCASDIDDDQKNVLAWRIKQSVAAYFFDEGAATLV